MYLLLGFIRGYLIAIIGFIGLAGVAFIWKVNPWFFALPITCFGVQFWLQYRKMNAEFKQQQVERQEAERREVEKGTVKYVIIPVEDNWKNHYQPKE